MPTDLSSRKCPSLWRHGRRSKGNTPGSPAWQSWNSVQKQWRSGMKHWRETLDWNRQQWSEEILGHLGKRETKASWGANSDPKNSLHFHCPLAYPFCCCFDPFPTDSHSLPSTIANFPKEFPLINIFAVFNLGYLIIPNNTCTTLFAFCNSVYFIHATYCLKYAGIFILLYILRAHLHTEQRKNCQVLSSSLLSHISTLEYILWAA